MPGTGDLKVGIAGRRGRAMVEGLRSIPEVALVALCDANSETLQSVADEHDIPERYRDFDEMIATDLDAVIVATPLQLHVPQTVAALRRVKHVLSEVTAAVTVEECPLLVEAVRQSGRLYMLAENCNYRRDIMT